MSTSRRVVSKLGPARIALLVVAALVVLAIAFPGLFAPNDPNEINADGVLAGPSWSHPLGTDEQGADVLSRIIFGLRLDVAVAAGSVALALLVGIPAGLLAGYFGRWWDATTRSLATAILSFPLILFAVLIVASFGASLRTLVGVLAFLFVPQVFMLVRAQSRALAARQFVIAAEAMGVSSASILLRHILPNALGPLLVLVPQLMAIAILSEAGLSYLGLGVQPPAITWGTLLMTAQNYYADAPIYAIATGLVVTGSAALLVWAGDLAGKAVSPLRSA